MIQRYEYFEHPADLGIIGHGENLESAIEGVIQGLFDEISDTDKVRAEKETSIEAEGKEMALDDLLVDLFSKILVLFESKKFLGKRARVTLTKSGESVCGIRAGILGEPVDNVRHTINAHIKAATYHGLKIWEDSSGWHLKMLFDV